jgi:ribosomal protein S18 acetylase RimI-like enzyme
MRRMKADVGKVHPGDRVVVRHRLGTPDDFGHTLTDVVGDFVGQDDGEITVATRKGTVAVPLADVVVVKVVPPRPVRRGAAHRALSVDGMQEVMLGAWGATEREWLGRWQLRAGGGYTMRANSVAVLGSPGLPLANAVDRALDWYAARSLPLNVTLAGPIGFAVDDDPLGVELLSRGARVAERCLTMTADSARVLAALKVPVGRQTKPTVQTGLLGEPTSAGNTGALPPARDTGEIEVVESVDDEWLAAHRGYRQSDRATAGATDDDTWFDLARTILMGSPAQRFARMRATDSGDIVALGRAGITPGWVGLGSIWVAPDRRREGLGTSVTRALLESALDVGARSSHLQVLSHNGVARAMYDAIGFKPHHDYVNVILEQP